MSILVLYATFPDEATADRICKTLIEEKKIACANIFAPMRSIYPWKGKLETSQEVGAFLKADRGELPQIEQRFLELHPYETPCLVEVSGDYANPAYAAWIKDPFGS